MGNPIFSARRFLGTVLPLLVLLVGCSSSPTPGTDPTQGEKTIIIWPSDGGTTDQREGCAPLPGEGLPGASIIFALTDSVTPDLAPVPHNPSERLVFAHLYETLVTVDCEGNLKPGLATAWACTEDSTLWVFTLRRDARFWDGSRVTSQDVRNAWAANQGCPRRGDQTPLWTWFNARAKTITLTDVNRLAIRLPEPQARFPFLLANPATAISVRRDGWTWPVGSGPARLRASTPAPMPDLECRPNQHHPQFPIWKSLTFRVMPASDSRDLVSTDVDLAMTRDLEAIRFFREMPGFQVAPLPWNRLYLLACPPEMNPSGTRNWTDLVRHLDPAKDLPRVAARSWQHLVFPAGGRVSCPQLSGPVAMDSSARRQWNLGQPELNELTIAYPWNDPAARELAQRLAALGPAQLRVAAIHPGALNFILNWQMAGAVILPTDQYFPTCCLQAATLLGRAAWLQMAALQPASTVHGDQAETLVQAEANSKTRHRNPLQTLLETGLVHPLALTHSWLITRGSWAGLELSFDGTPLLNNLGHNLGHSQKGGELP